MIVINARINSESVFSGVEATEFLNIFKTLNIKHVEVFDTNQLSKILEINKGKSIMLFSNFPPNSSYPESNSYKGAFRSTNEWEADSYSVTQLFFDDIVRKNTLTSVNIITGAPKDMLTFDMVKSTFPNSKVAIKYNSDFSSSDIGYKKSYMRYFEGLVKEFIVKII